MKNLFLGTLLAVALLICLTCETANARDGTIFVEGDASQQAIGTLLVGVEASQFVNYGGSQLAGFEALKTATIEPFGFARTLNFTIRRRFDRQESTLLYDCDFTASIEHVPKLKTNAKLLATLKPRASPVALEES